MHECSLPYVTILEKILNLLGWHRLRNGGYHHWGVMHWGHVEDPDMVIVSSFLSSFAWFYSQILFVVGNCTNATNILCLPLLGVHRTIHNHFRGNHFPVTASTTARLANKVDFHIDVDRWCCSSPNLWQHYCHALVKHASRPLALL